MIQLFIFSVNLVRARGMGTLVFQDSSNFEWGVGCATSHIDIRLIGKYG